MTEVYSGVVTVVAEVITYQRKQKNKCFYSNLVNENVLRIEDVKIKGKYLELQFEAEISCVAGHPSSTALLPLCGYIKTIISYDSNYQMIFKETC